YVFRIAVDAGGDPGARLARRPPDRHLLVLVRVPDRAPGRARARRLLAVRRLLPRVRYQGADVPVSHLAPRRARGGSHGRLGDPRRRAAQDGDLRVPPVCAAAVSGRRTAPRDPGGSGDARTDRDRVRRPGGDGPARLQEAHRLLVRGTPRLRDAGDLGPHAPERPGRPARDDQPRHLHGRAVLPGRDAVRAAPLPPDRRVRRYREGRAAARGYRVDRRVPRADPAPHGAGRQTAHPIGAARRRDVHGDQMSLDLTTTADLARALSPELTLTAAGMLALLVTAWRHTSARDL